MFLQENHRESETVRSTEEGLDANEICLGKRISLSRASRLKDVEGPMSIHHLQILIFSSPKFRFLTDCKYSQHRLIVHTLPLPPICCFNVGATFCFVGTPMTRSFWCRVGLLSTDCKGLLLPKKMITDFAGDFSWVRSCRQAAVDLADYMVRTLQARQKQVLLLFFRVQFRVPFKYKRKRDQHWSRC